MFELSKGFGFVVGLHVGYGYEFKKGFYVGGQVYASYDFTKIEHDDDNAEGKNISRSFMFNGEDKACSTNLSYRIDELKPMFGYGAAIQAGYKVCPNILAYVSFGVEGTYTKIKQVIAAETDFLIQNDHGAGFSFEATANDEKHTFVCASNGGDELSVNMISLVPGIGMKWFVSDNVYVGGQVDFLIGINKKVDSKHYSSKYNISYDGNTQAAYSLTDRGSELYINRKFAVRYGIKAGYQF